ncbi:hypothetical protein [Rhodoferax sp. PAMC 29310]|uniref:hypothetical protein n=1 Tax=Rhodoferax sp. PAMC 29310 TaxID=2822760 RepID=UPI001B333B61|nr:hypothetical protein [Rhodoferax sp. PAMC 29310]
MGVSLVASNAECNDRAVKVNALAILNRVARPTADLVNKVAERAEESSSKLVKRVSGKAMPARALATRKLRVTKAAARKVGEIVADTATETSNAARRVARQARSLGEKMVTAVANTSTETSNAARRVARKAEATANAACPVLPCAGEPQAQRDSQCWHCGEPSHATGF